MGWLAFYAPLEGGFELLQLDWFFHIERLTSWLYF